MLNDRSETIRLLDASKIKQYMECPRSFFFRYVLGWQPEYYRSKYHQVFGRALHIALEYILTHGYTQESVDQAYQLFLKDYRSEPEFTPETDDLREPKTPARALMALQGYVDRYAHEDANMEVLHTEVSGEVLVDYDTPVLFRVDAIVKDKNGIYVLEHKTASRMTQSWADQWALSVQVGLYTHLLMSMYNVKDVWGAKINGIFIYKSKAPDFLRVPVRVNVEWLEEWRRNLISWIKSIKQDLEDVENDTGRFMHSFRMNTQSCSNYYGCPYRDLCASWPNPVLHADDMPQGFELSWWDPRDLDKDAKSKVRTQLEPAAKVQQRSIFELIESKEKEATNER